MFWDLSALDPKKLTLVTFGVTSKNKALFEYRWRLLAALIVHTVQEHQGWSEYPFFGRIPDISVFIRNISEE